MRRVSQFEAQVLRILSFYVRRTPFEGTRDSSLPLGIRPRGLRADCLALVREMLSKGIVQWLATRPAAWQQRTWLSEGQPVTGRLWSRRPAAVLGLTFSENTVDFLMQQASSAMIDGREWQPVTKLTIGDQLLLFLAYARARDRRWGADWRLSQVFSRLPLCRLCFAADFAGDESVQQADDQQGADHELLSSWQDWLQDEAGVSILESMEEEIANHLFATEQAKRSIDDGEKMIAVGRCQRQSFASYLGAIDEAGRRDLARPLLRVLDRVRRRRWRSASWTGKLDVGDWPMAERLLAYRAAFQLLSSLDTLQAWQKEAMATGYFEDGYQAAQLWKSDWEFYNGSQLAGFTQEVLNEDESGLIAWASGDADSMPTTEEGDDP